MSSEAPHSRKSRLTVPAGADPLTGGRASAPFPSASGSSAAAMPIWQYLGRLTDVRQMDIQSALDQMKTLLSSRPQVVYKTAYYRKQTKNHWARDDPAFVALQGLFLLIASVAYSVAFRITLSWAISFILYTVVWVSSYFFLIRFAFVWRWRKPFLITFICLFYRTGLDWGVSWLLFAERLPIDT